MPTGPSSWPGSHGQLPARGSHRHSLNIAAAKLRTGLDHEAEPRELIRDSLTQRLEHGVLRNRADVVAGLEDAGVEVPRQSKNYVTARNPSDGKRWRLKGALY